MVRVVYRWQVPPEDFGAFTHTWRTTTNGIHATVPGAQGSFLLRSVDDPSEVLTIAKWDSFDAWREFWGNQNPEAMQRMRQLGTRVSVQAFEEIEDHTQ